MASDKYPLLIHVVPRLTPVRCGISDHVLGLAGKLKAAFGIDSAFAVLNSQERCEVGYPAVYRPAEELLQACESLAKGRPAALLFHVSGYGYSRDGAPTQLAGAAGRLKNGGRYPIAAYFHELYAIAAPWRSAFWHARRQRQAVSRIAAACELIVTNTSRHAEWLERRVASGVGRVRVLSVFSQAGEMLEPIPASARQPVMAVFGLGPTRQRAYRQLGALGSTLRDLGVEEFWDIGAEFDAPREIHNIPVRRLGVLESAEIANRLARVRFGFIWYPPSSLGKSGVFAAYCANGVIPVIARSFAAEREGLKDGTSVLSPGTAKAARASGLDPCSLAAWRWYSGHRLQTHAETYRQWLSRKSSEVETRACVMAADGEA